MSKSLGNMVFAADLLDGYPADAIRLYLLARGHREDWDYEEKGLAAWAEAARGLSRRLGPVEAAPGRQAFATAQTHEAGTGSLFGVLQHGFNLGPALGRLIEMSAVPGDAANLGAAKTFATQVFGLTLDAG